jgi:SAM-dependent methyltransferase
MFSPPDYSASENFLKPRRGPWTIVLALHRRPILEAVRVAAPLLTGRLLDVGCGNKPYASILQCAAHVGVDVPSSPHDQDRFDFVYDGKVLPFGKAEFDSVLCTEVLEHCPQPSTLMAEIARVLKPGGYVLITVPMVFHHHEEPYDFQRFTKYGVEELARHAGLELTWILPRGGLYATTVATFYTMVGYTLSRRPISDLIYWTLWPFAELALRLERLGHSWNVVSLGWQMLARKPLAYDAPP